MGLKSLLLLMLSFSLSTGCTRTNSTIVYASFNDTNIKAIRVATNKPIPVTIGDHYAEQDFGGYYIVSPSDLEGFLNALQRE